MTPGDEGDDWDIGLFARQTRALGDRVRVIRKSHRLSQRDVADRTGIGRPSISGIEGGKHNITLEVLWRLASALQTHWADLLDDRTTGAPEPQPAPVPFEQQLTAFGTRAYQARVLQRLSQQALQDRTGIGRSAISEIEDGTQNVTLETLSRLAAGLHVHWADLLDDRATNPPQPAHSRKRPR